MILKELAEMNGRGVKTSCTWYYEKGDEDMYELGNILKSLIDCPFVIIEVSVMDNARYEKILNGVI